MPSCHWSADEAMGEGYLAMATRCARAYAVFRDKYTPGAPMWVTESGDAGGGGDMRSPVMYLNGRPLTLGENDELPDMSGEAASGTVELAPGSCAFFVL